jgi:tetratricopeptide (TPR) repeat protein
VHDINKRAKLCFENRDTKSAVRLYKRALKLCEKYNLPGEAAAIHCNLARLYLEIKEYNTAYKHCEVSIDERPDNPEVCA